MGDFLKTYAVSTISAWVISLCALLYPLAALAGPIEDIRAEIDSGQYASALQNAKALETSVGYALAAEALSAQIFLGRFDDVNDRAIEALDLAERAYALNPKSENAQLQYALAYGVMTRTSSVFRAWRKKYPIKSFEIVDSFRRAYPNNARGDALLGAWHLGVIRKAGAGNAEKWYDATLSNGIMSYNTAMRAAPQDIIIASTFATALYAIDPEIYAYNARELLEWTASIPVQTALEREVQSRMAEILAVMDTEDGQKKAVKLSEAFLEGERREK